MRKELTLRDEAQRSVNAVANPEAAFLDDIRIASPCSARWEDMTGDARSRHCSSCDKRVYDISQLTAAQAVALVREKEGSLCLRLFRRADGRVLTADCPQGFTARLEQFRGGHSGLAWLPIVLVCGLVLFLLSWFAQPTMGAICPPDGWPPEEVPPGAPR